ncbi:MAG TPA: hypothetical protein VF062_06360 [Candidatus Limnocylindrales bacterium]
MCRRPEDPSKDAVLVATGDSVTSAFHQTKSAASTNCAINNAAADQRVPPMPGNDMMFSYAGRYYTNLNKNISEYYNFARVGFTTDDIIKASVAAGTQDACKNNWNRVKPPLDLADDAVKAAKAAGKKAYFVTTGGINNTNWTDMLIQFSQCRGLEVLTEAFKATAFSTNDTKFEYWARGQNPGQWDKIIDNGGGCRATWWVPRPWPFPPLLLNPIRIGVPAYTGPGGANLSPLAKQIAGDAKTIVDKMLLAGADKVVWMLYYSIIPAEVDLKAVVSEILGGYAGVKYLKDIVPWIFNLGDASLVPVQLVGRIRTLEADLNKEIKSQFPVNARLVVQPAPALGAGDIQKTVPMGCPHPNDKGHDKLANALKTAIG